MKKGNFTFSAIYLLVTAFSPRICFLIMKYLLLIYLCVKSSFTPSRDTIVNSPLVTFTSTSTGVTSYKRICGICTVRQPTSATLNLSTAGVHVIKLVVSSANCSDTSQIKVIYRGAQPPGKVYECFYGTEKTFTTAKKIVATRDSGFVIAGSQALDYLDSKDDIYLVKINVAGCVM